ncbi:MAG: HAMP domain-containing sensor histidine kinase [Candidatus Saccharimonadales bacterium]
MIRKIYTLLIEPRAANRNIRNRELVLNYVLLGIVTLSSLELITSLLVFFVLQQHYLLARLIILASITGFFVILYWLARSLGQQRFISFFLVGVLLLLSVTVAAEWGTVTPTAVLLFGLIITLAGILLSARYALYAAIFSSLALVILEQLKDSGIIRPDQTWMSHQSSISDVLGFSVIYAVIALVSWLFNRQMEQSLERAQKSEAALEKQNESLEQKVKDRTHQLEAAQLEKLQQIYRFAELGRISSALFHDLANHLTSVSLNIEDLNSQQQSGIMKRVQHDISYIDEVVQRVRLQLRGQGSIERFNVTKEVQKVADILNYKIVQYGIELSITAPSRPIMLETDLVPFRQIISNLLSNAIDSYEGTAKQRRPKIVIVLEQTKDSITINVTDWGIGISKAVGSKIFEPFYSSKADGTGIGLFIVKQIVETDLQGSITLLSNPVQGTTFSVNLPKNNENLKA